MTVIILTIGIILGGLLTLPIIIIVISGIKEYKNKQKIEENRKKRGYK